MKSLSAEAARAIILSEVGLSLSLFGHTPENVPDDFDLRASGVVDSLGFLEIVGALGAAAGFELDLEGLDPDELTVIGPLSRYVAGQSASGAAVGNGPPAAVERR